MKRKKSYYNFNAITIVKLNALCKEAQKLKLSAPHICAFDALESITAEIINIELCIVRLGKRIDAIEKKAGKQ